MFYRYYLVRYRHGSRGERPAVVESPSGWLSPVVAPRPGPRPTGPLRRLLADAV